MAVRGELRINVAPLVRRLNGMQKGLVSKHLLEALGNAQLRWVDQNFKAEGFEKKWKALSPITIARRTNKSSTILQDRGNLKNSFNKGGPLNKFNLTKATVTIGSQVQYASAHELGQRRIPQRKILPTKATAHKHAIKTIRNLMRDLIRASR